MATYIYKGKEITHREFLLLLRSAGINGGRKLSYYEVLKKESEKGNNKAIELFNNIEIKS